MQRVKVLGIPFHFGQEHKDVKDAPAYFRTLGLLEQLDKIANVRDLGNLDFSLCKNAPVFSSIKNELKASIANELISKCIESEDLRNNFLLNLGGDHGMALGTIHGLLSHKPDMVVIWADAHGDINTPETTLSGNFHGMPLSFLLSLPKKRRAFNWLKYTLSPRKLIYFGPRDLDESEKEIIEELSIQYYSSEEINRIGTKKLLDQALEIADPQGRCPLHLSFDVDVFDTKDIHSTGTKVDHGPRLVEIFKLGKLLGETGRLQSMDVVELNPGIGTQEQVLNTFFLTMEFIEATLKKSIRQKDFFAMSTSA